MDELTQEELDALPELQVDPNKKLYGSGSGLSDGSEPYSDRYEYVIRGLNGAYSEPEGADTEAESAGKILAALTGEGFPTALTLTVVGKDRSVVLEAVEASLAKFDGSTFEVEAEKPRKGGKFVSVTVNYVAVSAAMVTEVQADVKQAAGVMMCF